MATIISKKANNWVDRGEPPGPTLERILAYLFDRHTPADRPWLEEHATAVLGLVAADATEVQVVGYLNVLARELGYARGTLPGMRSAAIGLWHAAKAALVRDLAERVLRGEIPPNTPTAEPLGHWLAARLLTAEELAAFEQEGHTADTAGDDRSRGVR
ncbi:MAG: hypothetical protein ACREOJ_03825 [Gemmatimonadaceae bacterium]